MRNGFCILTAGRGTRARSAGTLNKALLPLKNTTILTHIIEKSPPDAQIIIAVGYQDSIIKEYCHACHADRDIVFVNVDNYDGPGCGPGYSLQCCKDYLQRPFYLCCSDCLVREELPSLDCNWLGVKPITNPIHWSTAKVSDGNIVDFMNKSENGFDHAWIGIAGIKDYQTFWSKLSHVDKEFEAISAFYTPLDYGEIKAKHFTWFDTGTGENYHSSVQAITGQGLGMAKVIDEVTCKYKSKCVKIFGSIGVCKGQIHRAKVLSGLVPKLSYEGEHVYAYDWIEGKTMYEYANLEVFTKFLDWCDEHLWEPVNADHFDLTCLEFYKCKTQGRFAEYLRKKKLEKDSPNLVNGRHCESMEYYLSKIDWNLLAKGQSVKFHGDLQPENIIVAPGSYHLIDWRDSFAGHAYGDIYYDLAKLNGGLGMSYNSIKKNSFHVSSKEGIINYYFDMPRHLGVWRHYYENWLLKKGFDLYKIRLITALIYLNMSPLHVAPFDELLFNHSKWLLSLTC